MDDELLTNYYKNEICYILKNYSNLEVKENDLKKVKLIFIKQYSDELLRKIDFFIKNRLFIIINLFNNDNIDYVDKKNRTIVLVDLLTLYSFKIGQDKYYLCYSKRYDKQDNISLEKVEIFFKS